MITHASVLTKNQHKRKKTTTSFPITNSRNKLMCRVIVQYVAVEWQKKIEGYEILQQQILNTENQIAHHFV